MKRTLVIILMSLVLGLLSLRLAEGAPRSDSQLLNEFRTALKARDQTAILGLFNWQGVNPEMELFERQIVAEMVKRDFQDVHLSPFPGKYPLPFDAGGVHYALNMDPVGVITVESKQPTPAPPFAYGRNGGAYYIAAITEKEITADKPEGGPSLIIDVQDANGKPLQNAAVVSASPNTPMDYELNTLFGGIHKFWTDDHGQFRLSLTDTNLFLVAVNEAGFGLVHAHDLTNHAVMVIRPWGRIEGVRMNRNHPVPDENLKLSPDRDFYGNGAFGSVPEPMDSMCGQEARTDAQGRFTFEHVPPFKLFIDRQEKQRGYWGYFWSVDARSGGTNKLEIDTRERTVVGRVKIGPGLDANIDLASISGTLMSDLKGRERSRCSVGFPVSADGSFRADRVEPGDYTVSGDIRHDGKQVAFLDPISLHVPDDTSDAVDVPFDIGSVTLKGAVNFMEGDTAPDFSCRTLDDKPLKLSSFRGKYVLLDFWATWCVPCVAETPNLKATYDAFGKDERFVMISLSLDSDEAAPRRFAQIRGIGWTQGFLGDRSKDKEAQRYGVYGIPAIFLIGPDGKILATQLRGTNILATVSANLPH